jgi:large subunit ribosomal protein L29
VSKLSERRREIHAMDRASAQQELKDLRRKLFELRLQKERGEVKNNRQFMQVRADIARLMFHLSELRYAERMEAADAPAEVAPVEGAAPEELELPVSEATTPSGATAAPARGRTTKARTGATSAPAELVGPAETAEPGPSAEEAGEDEEA